MGRGSLRREFLVDNLNLPLASGVEDAEWEDFQLDLIEDDSPLRIDSKSRQIAWSFILAADFLADALLFGTDGIFVSINLDEAAEKIRYARSVYMSLELDGLPKLSKNNSLNLEFSNGARLSSLPAKPPRGRARSNVGLDEFAHSPRDREILKGAIPIISKGGRLRVGSSPLGNRGSFWDIVTETTQKYPGYVRHKIPWWEIRAFCKDVGIAKKEAQFLDTEERVARFGKPRLLLIFQNTIREDFQQEYECDFGAGDESWIDYEELLSVSDPELLWARGFSVGKNLEGVYQALEKLSKLVELGKVSKNLYLGYDVGRRRDLTEIVILEKTKKVTILRGLFSLSKVSFPEQEKFLHKAWVDLSIRGGKIDETGIGMQLAENGKAKLRGCTGETFTNAKKAEWARSLKIAIQEKKILLPVDRTIHRQFTSLKRKVSDSGNFVFDVDSNESHHADIFWASGLSLSAVNAGQIVTGMPATNASSIRVPSRGILVPQRGLLQVPTGSFLDSIKR